MIKNTKVRRMYTKDKDAFLQGEYNSHFNTHFSFFSVFKYEMESDAIKCKSCGFYYWIDNKKRCDC